MSNMMASVLKRDHLLELSVYSNPVLGLFDTNDQIYLTTVTKLGASSHILAMERGR